MGPLVRAVAIDAARRVLSRLSKDALRAASKPNGFLSWLDGFENTHRVAVAEILGPATHLVRGVNAGTDVAGQVLQSFHAQLLDVSGRAKPHQLAQHVGSFFASLDGNGPEEIVTLMKGTG